MMSALRRSINLTLIVSSSLEVTPPAHTHTSPCLALLMTGSAAEEEKRSDYICLVCLQWKKVKRGQGGRGGVGVGIIKDSDWFNNVRGGAIGGFPGGSSFNQERVGSPAHPRDV